MSRLKTQLKRENRKVEMGNVISRMRSFHFISTRSSIRKYGREASIQKRTLENFPELLKTKIPKFTNGKSQAK